MELDAESMPVLRDLGNGLLCSYVVDVGPQFQYVQNCHLAEQGVTANELHDIALRNLLHTVADEIDVRRFEHACAVVCGGNFEASLLLIDSLWEMVFEELVAGPIAAAIPARDILVFCAAGNPRGIAELRDVIERVWPLDDHTLTRNLYVRVDREWRVFE